MSIQELITRMMAPSGVPVVDKTYGFTRYKRCFTGADAVKWLVASRIARSEEEAVTIGHAFLIKAVIFPVAHSGDFTNSYLLYQWAADREAPIEAQKPAPVPVFSLKASGVSDASDSASESDSSDSELEESAQIGRRLSRRNPNRRVVFDLSKIEYDETFSKYEYERAADFDMDKAMDEWELEEQAEKERQAEVRWQTLERALPAGTLCEERIKHREELERLRLLKEENERREQELRRARLEQIAAQRAMLAAKKSTTASFGPPPSYPSRPLQLTGAVPVVLLDREELENAETEDDEAGYIETSPAEPPSTPATQNAPAPKGFSNNDLVFARHVSLPAQPRTIALPDVIAVDANERSGSAPPEIEDSVPLNELDTSINLSMFSPLKKPGKVEPGTPITIDIAQLQLNSPDPMVWKQQVRDAMEIESQRRELERRDREQQAKLEIERKLRDKAQRREAEKLARESGDSVSSLPLQASRTSSGPEDVAALSTAAVTTVIALEPATVSEPEPPGTTVEVAETAVLEKVAPLVTISVDPVTALVPPTPEVYQPSIVQPTLVVSAVSQSVSGQSSMLASAEASPLSSAATSPRLSTQTDDTPTTAVSKPAIQAIPRVAQEARFRSYSHTAPATAAATKLPAPAASASRAQQGTKAAQGRLTTPTQPPATEPKRSTSPIAYRTINKTTLKSTSADAPGAKLTAPSKIEDTNAARKRVDSIRVYKSARVNETPMSKSPAKASLSPAKTSSADKPQLSGASRNSKSDLHPSAVKAAGLHRSPPHSAPAVKVVADASQAARRESDLRAEETAAQRLAREEAECAEALVRAKTSPQFGASSAGPRSRGNSQPEPPSFQPVMPLPRSASPQRISVPSIEKISPQPIATIVPDVAASTETVPTQEAPKKIVDMLSKFMTSFPRTRPLSAGPTLPSNAVSSEQQATAVTPTKMAVEPSKVSTPSVPISNPANVSSHLSSLIRKFESGPMVVSEDIKHRRPVVVSSPYSGNTLSAPAPPVSMIASSAPVSPQLPRRSVASTGITSIASAFERVAIQPGRVDPAPLAMSRLERQPSPLKRSVEDTRARTSSPLVSQNVDPRARTLPIETLRGSSNLVLASMGVDVSIKEQYLSDTDFQSEFKMTKEEFGKLPQWRQLQLKRAGQLF